MTCFERFDHPLIEGIDFPRVLVAEARWLADAGKMIVELAEGHDAPPTARFRVTGVEPGTDWSVTRAGKAIGKFGPDGIASGVVASGPAADTTATGELLLEVPLKGRVRLEIERAD